MSKISDIQRASNVASTDLILVTGNVGATETSYSVEWKNANSYYQQTVSVAKEGGDYTSIQAAIDSISDAASNKKYAVEIYPGVYTENVVMKAFVGLVGKGAAKGNCVLAASSGTIMTLPIDGPLGSANIKLQATGTAKCLELATGAPETYIYKFQNCAFTYTQASGYTDIAHLQSGTVTFGNCVFIYKSTGTTSGTNTHRILNMGGTSTYEITNSSFDGSIEDTADELALVLETSGGGHTLVMSSNFDAEGHYSVLCFDIETAGANRDIENNHIHLVGNADGTGICFKMANAASEIHSTGNRIIVEGFTLNYYASIGLSAEFFSSLDNIDAVEGLASSSGDIQLVSSILDGHISMSNVLIQTYDGTGGVNVNQANPGVAVPFDVNDVIDGIYTHSTSVNPTRIAVNSNGIYSVHYKICWQCGGNNTEVKSQVFINGVTASIPSGAIGFANSSGVYGINQSSSYMSLEDGDYIEIYLYNQSGSTAAANTVPTSSLLTVSLVRAIDVSVFESSSSSSSVDSSSSSEQYSSSSSSGV